MKNLAIVCGRFPVRSETFVANHALGMAERGYEVTLLSRGPGIGIGEDEITKYSNRFKILWSEGGYKSKFSLALEIFNRAMIKKETTILQKLAVLRLYLELVRKRQLLNLTTLTDLIELEPDLIHVHFANYSNAIALAKNICLIESKIVVTWHGWDVHTYTRTYGAGAYKELIRANVAHTVGSKFMKKQVAALGVRDCMLHLVRMGIDTNKFKVTKSNHANREVAKIISIGRLVEGKGHVYLIRAVAKVLALKKNTELLIIGDGPERDNLKNEICLLGVEDKVKLWGAVTSDAVALAMQKADIFALTGVLAKDGWVESQGLVFAEAQASGLPVIGSRFGGVSESLVDGSSGLLCQPGNVEEIVEAITFFLNNPEKMRQFGLFGREFVEANFSLNSMLDIFEDLYRRASA